MNVAADTTSDKNAQYAHPERLVTTQWLADHLGTPGLVVVESDEDVLLYETGHIPGAVKIDWHTDLNDPDVRDYIDGARFARLLGSKGITRDTTVVVYGDKGNWWAAYTLWVLSLFGHEDVRLLDGGRSLWIAEGRATTTDAARPTAVEYPVVERDDSTLRAFKEDVLTHLGNPIVDIRSPREYNGELAHMPDYPNEGALRTGHIPTARNVPWATAVAEDGTYRSRSELEAIYQSGGLGLKDDDSVITYCRIGERSSHTWFALKHLLGIEPFDRPAPLAPEEIDRHPQLAVGTDPPHELAVVAAVRCPVRRDHGSSANARTGNVPNPATFGGTAVSRAPLGGSAPRFVRCSTTWMPAARKAVWAGRSPCASGLWSSMLIESIPTSVTCWSARYRTPSADRYGAPSA